MAKKTKVVFTSKRWTGKTDEFQDAFNQVCCNIKIMFGALNNSMFLLMSDAVDKVRKCDNYHDDYRRWTKHVWDSFKHYEATLKYESGFFSVKDLADISRKFYAEDLTDTEFFDYWCASGGKSVEVIKPMCMCLANKYRLLLERWGTKDAGNKAELVMVFTMLSIHDDIWKQTCKKVAENLCVRVQDIANHFTPLRMNVVSNAVWKLMRETIPEMGHQKPDELEAKNIEHSKIDIMTKIDTTDFYFGGIADAAEQYNEVFRTKGYERKMMRIIEEARSHFSQEAEKL